MGSADHRMPCELAASLLTGERVLLLSKEGGQVGLHPYKLRSQVQAVGAGVEARGQVEDPVAAAVDRVGNEVVDELCS